MQRISDDEITLTDALGFLESALTYIQKTGTRVKMGQRGDTLYIGIVGAIADATTTGTHLVPLLAKEPDNAPTN